MKNELKGFEDVINNGLEQYDIVEERVFDFLGVVCGIIFSDEQENLYQLDLFGEIRTNPDNGEADVSYKTFRKHKGGYIYVGECFFRESVERGEARYCVNLLKTANCDKQK